VIPVAGGVASYAEPDSPINKVAGLGFAGLPDPTVLDTVDRAFAARGAPVQAEVASLADPFGAVQPFSLSRAPIGL
jgi:hypothetical protein